MTAVRLPHRWTTEEYLAFENANDGRHEFVGGEVYAMVGGTDVHNLLCTWISSLLIAGCPRTCQVFSQGMKLCVHRADDGDDYYYPDIFVSCSGSDRERLSRDQPCLIVEVLSPSTERIDRGEKMRAYRSIPSLIEYVIVCTDRPQVEVYNRASGWSKSVFAAGSPLTLASIGVTLTVDQVYDRTAF